MPHFRRLHLQRHALQAARTAIRAAVDTATRAAVREARCAAVAIQGAMKAMMLG